MDIRKINDMFAVTGQITPKDVSLLAGMGFKTIICNRPDGEETAQTPFAQISEQAKKMKMRSHLLAIERTGVTPAQQDAFDRFLFECPKPVIAYCHSGTRSSILWGAFNVGYNYKYMGPERRKARAEPGSDNAAHRRRTSDYDSSGMDRARRKVGLPLPGPEAMPAAYSASAGL